MPLLFFLFDAFDASNKKKREILRKLPQHLDLKQIVCFNQNAPSTENTKKVE